jgi:preprotein translocase subunit Sec61beta
MFNRWKSLERCAEGMLSNFAVVGIGLALYEQKLWPALIIGSCAAVAALLIAWGINHD